MEKINYIGLSGEEVTIAEGKAKEETDARCEELFQTLQRALAQTESLQSLVRARGLNAWADILSEDIINLKDQVDSLK